MRVDKYLKVSRIIKRRTIANEACDAGKILANGNKAKASYDVKVGDILEVCLGSKSLKVQVVSIAPCVKKEEAENMYKVL